MSKTTELLLVDDNLADRDLTTDALSKSKCHSHVHWVCDGVEAIEFLRRKGKYTDAVVPDLVLLDLNLPRKDGRAVLAEAKSDAHLKRIPIIVFSTSCSQRDISSSYELGANSYVSKPSTLAEFIRAITALSEFWFDCAELPHREE